MRHFFFYDKSPEEYKSEMLVEYSPDPKIQEMLKNELDWGQLKDMTNDPTKLLSFGLQYEYLLYFEQIGGMDNILNIVRGVTSHERKEAFPFGIMSAFTDPFKS